MAHRTNILLLAIAGALGIFCLVGRLAEQNQLQHQDLKICARGPETVSNDHTSNQQERGNMHYDPGNPHGSHRIAEARMKRRRDMMHSACAKYGLNQTLTPEQIYVNNPYLKTSLFYSDKYKLLLCGIPKCGSTNQAKFLVTMEGLVSAEELKTVTGTRAVALAEKMLSARRATNISEIANRIGTYRKLVIVREPFSRLLSAFRNKLHNNNRGDFYAKVAEKIHADFRGEQLENPASEITLDDFIMHLIGPKRNAQKDPHWNFYNRLCSPCFIDYDFITHMETLEEDVDYVKNEMGIEGISFPASYNSFTDWEKVEKYFGQASSNLVNALYYTYKMDYEIFGYPPPPQF